MSTNGNGNTQTILLVLIGVVFVFAVGGIVFVKEKATEIIGFGSMIVISLLAMLQKIRADAIIQRDAKDAKIAAAAATVAATAAKDAAVSTKVEIAEIKADTSEGLKIAKETAATGELTHDLANSAMLGQKRVYAEKCRASAIEKPTAVNLAEADAAEAVYREHKVKQEQMDAEAKKA